MRVLYFVVSFKVKNKNKTRLHSSDLLIGGVRNLNCEGESVTREEMVLKGKFDFSG